MEKIKVLLADNQPLTVAGLTSILNEKDDVVIVDQVITRESLSESLEQHKPDLLIVDYDLSGYITREDLYTIKEFSPVTNVLVISSDNDKNSILKVLQSGVIGYLTKECSKEEILMAVYAVARGEKFFCHKILNIIMEKHFSPEPEEVVPGVLTVRETEILAFLASGYSTQKVADELHLSPHTVHTHRKSIIKKLNIKSPTEFVIYALDFGLIKAK
jgi:two-component system, NarL family, invasion response regulator UvrY